MLSIRVGLVMALLCVLWSWPLSLRVEAQQPTPKTCKDTPERCDKELTLLRGEVDQKRSAMAALWEQAEALQKRVEQAEAKIKELEATPPTLPPASPEPVSGAPQP